MTAEHPRCVVCASPDVGLHRTDVRDFEYSVEPERRPDVFACRQCGSEFLAPRPSEEDLPAFYPSHYHAYHDDHSALAKSLVSMRSRQRATYYRKLCGGVKSSIFDVGTGDCRHFKALEEFGDFKFAGVEINKDIFAKARALGYDVTLGTLESMDISDHRGRYDVVSMNHVLEHVVEPRLMLSRALELLRPGGYAIGQLPCNTSWEARIFGRYWAGYHYPRHLQMFSRTGLKRLLDETGFVDVKVIPAPHLQSALSLQNTLIGQGWNPPMKFGKCPAYSLMLLAVAPFELLAWCFGATGIVNFEARRATA
jgi:SAM-dependent methyltransferase